uniref:Uncharacterized protein n=1 Tax=Oryza glumipatula TaxID=40148 RepID=A0A0E0BJB8_9ORYZ
MAVERAQCSGAAAEAGDRGGKGNMVDDERLIHSQLCSGGVLSANGKLQVAMQMDVGRKKEAARRRIPFLMDAFGGGWLEERDVPEDCCAITGHWWRHGGTEVPPPTWMVTAWMTRRSGGARGM